MYTDEEDSAAYVFNRIGAVPDTAVVLGSGLDAFAGLLENPVVVPYGEIPHFLKSTAPGHKGQMSVGTLGGKRVLCMQGRFHYYEGYKMQDITYYVRVLKMLGIPSLIMTNAAGGIDLSYKPGDFMLITDHINYMGVNPLIGPNNEKCGPRFVDMTYAYDLSLRDTVKHAAANVGIGLKEGVYVGYMGPSFETPAEIRMMRLMGGSAVGMSTVPEVIEANHCGIPVAGITCVTNMAAGILEQRLSGDEVIKIGERMKSGLAALLSETISLL